MIEGSIGLGNNNDGVVVGWAPVGGHSTEMGDLGMFLFEREREWAEGISR